MTKDEARALLRDIRAGRELRILNQDGEWGVRAAGGQLIQWDHPAWGASIYGLDAERTITEDEAIELLATQDATRMRAHLFSER